MVTSSLSGPASSARWPARTADPGPPPNPAEATAGLAIAEASAAVAMHPQTLRKYERAGLLRPARRSGGARSYSPADLERLALIKHMADERGINVAGMALALALHDELLELLEALEWMEPTSLADYLRERLDAMLQLIGNERPVG